MFILTSCKQEKASTENETEEVVEIQNDFEVVKDAVLSAGKLYRIENFESNFVSSRNIDVWLPENYSDTIAYATLYMHDGQMLFDSTTTWNKQEWKVDETVSSLMKESKIKPTIVVGMWNVTEDRHTDYFPQQPWENLPDSTRQAVLDENHAQSESLFRKEINSDNYIKFITEEVLPLVETNFNVSRNLKDRAVAGSSMGGLISWYTVLEKPNLFGTAICISTHWPGAMPIENNPIPEAFFSYIKEKLPMAPNNHKFYFDFGTETLDALYPPFEEIVNEVFASKNYKESSFRNLKFEGTNHSENAWNQRLHIPLEFALHPEPSID
ncbi:esterase [Psychroflexus planctonicus]|uniref:Esterase n=1 Tax=Psychroflexus planctonicus TaxID=1526575 RepID=A0ABQ1SE24_9FLAO|nr:esterase [Psychroflexus planctonicus]